MPSLNMIPAELVLRILDDVPIEDIISVTQTSSFLYSIGRSSRALWKHARDAHRLPIPMGQTLDTVPVPSLSALAARAIALSTTWASGVAHPRRVTKIESPYHPGYQGIRTLVGPHATLLPGNQWILLGMNTDPYVYCIANGKYIPLGIEGSVRSYAYESSDNGASITLAILKATWRGRPHEYDWFFDIFLLSFDPSSKFNTLPTVKRAQSIRLPRYARNIAIKGSLVVVTGGNRLFLSDWIDGSGFHLNPSLHRDPEDPVPADEIFEVKAVFHPSLPLLVVVKRVHPNYSIHVIDIPPFLKPLEGPDLCDERISWSVEPFASTCVHEAGLYHMRCYEAFRSGHREAPVFDVVSDPHRSGHEELKHLSISALGESRPTIRRRPLESRELDIFGVCTTAGHTVCLGTKEIHEGSSENANELSFLCMPAGATGSPKWVKLELPRWMMASRGWSRNVLAFDDVYGTLLFDSSGTYYVFQY